MAYHYPISVDLLSCRNPPRTARPTAHNRICIQDRAARKYPFICCCCVRRIAAAACRQDDDPVRRREKYTYVNQHRSIPRNPSAA